MGLGGAISSLSRGLGRGRTLLRRLGGLALVFLGVHGATDLLDDHLFALLDRFDLLLDSGLFAVGAWLESVGILSGGRGGAFAEGLGEWVGLGEKEWLALSLALALELVADAILLPLAWGSRPPPARLPGLAGLRLVDWVGIFALGILPIGGGIGVARGVELGLARSVGEVAPGLPLIGAASAVVGILLALLILVRFVPDLLRGALARAGEEGDVGGGGIRARLQGAWRVLVIAPVALGGMLLLPGGWALLVRALRGLL